MMMSVPCALPYRVHMETSQYRLVADLDRLQELQRLVDLHDLRVVRMPMLACSKNAATAL